MNPPRDEALREHLRRIESAARDASHLANQLMAFAGKGRFTFETIDLDALVPEARGLVDAELVGRASIEFELHGRMPPVEGDRTQLLQVVANLLTNALESLPRGGRGNVTCTTGVVDADAAYLRTVRPEGVARPGRYAFVEVSDDGCGLEPDAQRRLFDPFFSTKRSGRGLGLPAVMGALRLHRGCIHVKSARGKGSAFRILLPLTEGGLPLRSGETPPPRPWQGSGGALVVDDQPEVRTVARVMLENLGFDVEAAAGGAQAVELYRRIASTTPLVLVDVTMAGLGGVETVEALRAIRPDLVAVLMSGFTEEEIMKRAGRPCVAGFIQKPFDMRILSDKLRTVFESRAPSGRAKEEA
jgi:two-component system, cell cycle sensor histidine kinase and response regulator CckA